MNDISRSKIVIPLALEPMEDINCDKHTVYQGIISLVYKEKSLLADGTIYYVFNEHNKLLIEGETTDNIIRDCSGERLKITSKSIKGELLITRITDSNTGCYYFWGVVTHVRKGKEEQYPVWKWAYANMKYFRGESVKSRDYTCLDRLTFNADCYKIIFENRFKLTNYANDCPNAKYLSHYCQLEHIEGKCIDYKKASDIIICFSLFVSFVVGRRHGPYFIQGVDHSDNKTEYHRVYIEDTTTNVFSWKPDLQEKDIVTLWDGFYDVYSAMNDETDIMTTAIHWYLEANAYHGMLEGAFMMAFAGLELMHNAITNELASNNNEELLRRLIDIIHIRDTISAASIANMRNQLVHYDSKNRRKYKHLSREEKVRRMSMLLQLLELSILYWLEYKGHYCDRFHSGYFAAEKVSVVPWNTNE